MEAYPNLDEFFEDLAQAYREEIAALAAAGCTYLQLDDTVRLLFPSVLCEKETDV